jgi:hypothetical protein
LKGFGFCKCCFKGVFVYVDRTKLLKDVEENFALLLQIKEITMMVSMKVCNLMEDHNHQL